MDLGKVKEISISGSTTIIDEEDFPERIGRIPVFNRVPEAPHA